MRIAFFSDNFYPELSGISDSLISLAKGLAARGHLVNLYVPKYSATNYRLAGQPARADLNLGGGIKIVRFSSLPFPGSGTGKARIVIPSFWRWLKVKEFKPEIIHTNHFFGVGLEALIASRLLKVPLVGTNHTAIAEFIRYSPVKIKSLGAKSQRYVNWYYNHCQLVTAPGQSLLAEMEQNGLTSSHQVIANPVDLETFVFAPQKKAQFKKDFRLGQHVLVYAGRLAAEKNVDVLIRALALAKEKIPDITLAIAGEGKTFTENKKLAADLSVGGTVKFLGMLDKKTLNKLYNAAEIFTIASTSEVQSMTILQAMACGLPVIGARARGITAAIKGNGFLFEPNNHEELAKTIILLLNDKKLQQKFSQKSLTEVKIFSSGRIMETWEKIYNKLILAR